MRGEVWNDIKCNYNLTSTSIQFHELGFREIIVDIMLKWHLLMILIIKNQNTKVVRKILGVGNALQKYNPYVLVTDFTVKEGKKKGR